LQRILRSLPLLAALLVAVAGLVACGGKAGESASSGDSVDTLLKKTFSGDKQLDSAKVDLKLKMNIQGSGQVSGPIDISISGPFQTQGKGKLPKLDLDLSFAGAGQNIKAGVESTGDKGFVNFNGQEYALSDKIFQQFKTGYEQAAAKGAGGNKKGASLATLGINPRDWLTNAKNEGDAKVGDADVVKITGGVDVGKLLDDVNTALAKAGSLGLQGTTQIPTKITDAQKAQVAKAVKDIKVEIYTGKDDSLLRRILISLSLQDPKNKGDVTLDLSLLDVNKDQEFKVPANTKPFDELLQSLGSLGLGGLGGSSSGSGSSGGSSSGGGSSGSGGDSAAQLKKYSDCLKNAGQDLTKAQKCAQLLTP
jgi:uncharacterized membrane protein YgcG